MRGASGGVVVPARQAFVKHQHRSHHPRFASSAAAKDYAFVSRSAPQIVWGKGQGTAVPCPCGPLSIDAMGPCWSRRCCCGCCRNMKTKCGLLPAIRTAKNTPTLGSASYSFAHRSVAYRVVLPYLLCTVVAVHLVVVLLSSSSHHHHHNTTTTFFFFFLCACVVLCCDSSRAR